ncbi:MAG: hypothetical protein Q8P41_00530 [Pseudomonadota bacterium]|nr:hypothetical protein [Pseudomonadota bacterium]
MPISPFLVVLAVLASGCAAPEAPEGTDGPTDSGTPPDLSVEPSLTAEEVAAEVEAVFASGFPDARAIQAAYLGLMGAGDDGCPGDATQLTGRVPVNGCSSEGGYFYLGVSAWIHTEEWDDVGNPRVTDSLDGDFEIDLPTGERFQAGGFATYSHVGNELQWVARNYVSGTWSFDGAPGPLGEGISAAVGVRVESAPETRSVEVTGATSSGEHAALFEDFRLDTLECAGNPTGAMRLRGSDGLWYELRFADDCSGCGDVSFFDSTPLGVACPSFAGVAERLILDATVAAE